MMDCSDVGMPGGARTAGRTGSSSSGDHGRRVRGPAHCRCSAAPASTATSATTTACTSGRVALTNGVLPYRDFLLLHPPGIAVLLSPFALIAGATSATGPASPSPGCHSWRSVPSTRGTRSGRSRSVRAAGRAARRAAVRGLVQRGACRADDRPDRPDRRPSSHRDAHRHIQPPAHDPCGGRLGRHRSDLPRPSRCGED